MFLSVPGTNANGDTVGWVKVSKCSAYSDTALRRRRNNRDDGLTTAGQTATRWKTTEFTLKMKQRGQKRIKRKEEQR